MHFKYTTNPAAEPIALADAKNYLRIDHSNDDTLITRLIKAARQQAENILQFPLGEVTVEIYTAATTGIIILPVKPVVSIDQVQYNNGTSYGNIDAEDYEKIVDLHQLKILDLPTDIDKNIPLKIVITAGSDTIDEGIKQALYLLVADSYDNRNNYNYKSSLAEKVLVNYKDYTILPV